MRHRLNGAGRDRNPWPTQAGLPTRARQEGHRAAAQQDLSKGMYSRRIKCGIGGCLWHVVNIPMKM